MLSLHLTSVCSQNNNSSLFFKHHGYWDDPYKIHYVLENMTSDNEEELNSLISYYNENRTDLLSKMDLTILEEIVAAMIANKPPRSQVLATLSAAALNVAVQTAATIQEQKALEAQQTALRREQQMVQNQVYAEQRRIQATEFDAVKNGSHIAQTESLGSSSSIQSREMETSDLNSYMATQMSNNVHGVQATQDALRQQAQNNYESTKTGGYGGHIISAVTANRRSVTIQVRDKQVGGRIIAYSLGANTSGKQQWIGTEGVISKCTTTYEFQYTGYIRDLGEIYFNM